VDEHDRRISRIVITPAGEEKWYLVRSALCECSLDVCSGLSEPEQQTLLSLLSRLLDKASHSDPILCTMKQGESARD
jgi:DNA-binding MarR family transcriptional regulator